MFYTSIRLLHPNKFRFFGQTPQMFRYSSESKMAA